MVVKEHLLLLQLTSPSTYHIHEHICSPRPTPLTPKGGGGNHCELILTLRKLHAIWGTQYRLSKLLYVVKTLKAVTEQNFTRATPKVVWFSFQ